ADLREAKFHGATLHFAILYKARLDECEMANARLRGANLHSAKMERSDFVEADLRGVVLKNANISECEFLCADLTGSNLEDANASFACFERAILNEVLFAGCELEGAGFPYAEVQETILFDRKDAVAFLDRLK